MDETTGSTPTPPAPETPITPAPVAGGRPGPASDTSKLLAALGYVIWPVAVVAILIEPYKDEKFVKFHAIQAIALVVGWVIVGVAANIPVVGWVLAPIASIAILVLGIMGLIKAFGGEYWEMPLIYDFIKGYIGD